MDTNNRYSGGLSVEDLRRAWALHESSGAGLKWNLGVVSTLSNEWHRTDKAVRIILGTLRSIRRGVPPSAQEKSTLYNMTEAERTYVFTGKWPEAERITMAATPPMADDPGSHPGILLAEMRDLLRELVGLTRQAWGQS